MPMCAPVAGSVRGKPGTPRGLARHSEGALAHCSLADLKRFAMDLA